MPGPSSIATATLALLAVAAAPVGAQGTPGQRPIAASAASANDAAATRSTYRSAFDGRRPFADQPVGSWRDANAVVGQVGGWRAYAREAAGGEGAASTPAKGHAGHKSP